jgi:hypothetical protein
MKYTSALISDARNKLGGDVFARNRSGLYVRVKVKPKNPRTTIQQANRASFSAFAKAWRSLSAAQIAGWNTLSSGSALTDTLGNSFQPSGIQMFVSCNRNLAQLGLGPLSSPPATKPSFPLIVADVAYVDVHLGAWGPIYVHPTPAAYALWSRVVLYLTGAQSSGVTFYGASLFRFGGAATALSGSYISFLPQPGWPANVPAPGSRIGLKVKMIDPSTGYAGMLEPSQVVVNEV